MKREYIDIHEEGEILYQKFHSVASSEVTVTNIPTRVNKSWTLTVLARGKTSGADKLLDWMASSVIREICVDKTNVRTLERGYGGDSREEAV